LDSSSVHHLEFLTAHKQWYISHRFADSFWSCPQAVSKPAWHIPLLCTQSKTPDNGQRNCPKHVEFYSKKKFEKLVLLVGFIIRIYHNVQSPERQILSSDYSRTLRVELYLPVVPKHAMKPCTGTTYCTEENIKHLHKHLQQMKQPDCIQLKLKSCIQGVHRFKN